MLYGSETWYLRENEMAVLRRTERAMVRAMSGAKTDGENEDREPNGDVGIEGKGSSDGNGHVLRKALELEGKGKRKGRRPKKTWKMQVEESKSVGLDKMDAMNQARQRVGVGEIAAKVG